MESLVNGYPVFNALAKTVSCTQNKHCVYVTAAPDVMFDVLVQTTAALPPIRSRASGNRAS